MKCPVCTNEETTVKDSRTTKESTAVRRRRICTKCDYRFTTFEVIQPREIKVIKESGSTQAFDRGKLYRSIEVAARKRSISKEDIEIIVNNILYEFEHRQENVIKTKSIGDLVMDELAKRDPVAYIRFASVYLNFDNVEDFIKVVKRFYK